MPIRINRDVACVLILLLASTCMWATRLRGGIDLRWDGGVYYVLGTSIAEGKGYRLLNEPGDIEAVQYPPGLPALVAIHQLLLGTNDPTRVGHALKLTYFAIYSSLVACTFTLARRHLRATDSLFVALIAGLTVHLFFLSDLLFAELPFTLVSILFVLSNTDGANTSRTLATASLGASAYLLRTSGMALLAAWFLEAVARRRWKQAVIRAVLAAVPVLVWQWYIATVRTGPEYRAQAYAYQRALYQFYNVGYDENIALVDPFKPELGRATASDVCSRVAANLPRLPFAVGRTLLTAKSLDNRSFGLSAVAELSMAGILAAGLASLMWRRIWLEPIYVFVALALICLTPWPKQLGRYTAPLAPFFALALLYLLRMVAEALTSWFPAFRRFGTPAVCCVALLFASRQAMSDYSINAERAREGPILDLRGAEESGHFFHGLPWTSLEASARWLADHSEAGEIVATASPHQFYLAGVSRAVMFPMEPDPHKAQDLLDTASADYLVIDADLIEGITGRYATPVVNNHRELWELIYESPDKLTTIYRRRTKPTP